jgi:DNA-binding transcriptional LysR family regulator
VVVFPPGTERATPVRVAELEDVPLVVSRQSQTPQLKAQQQWLASGAARIVAEADNLDGTIELVLAGIGAAVMSIDGAAAAVERGAVIASLDPPSFYPVGLVYRSGRLSPVEREYHALVLERARSLRDDAT